MGSPANAGGDSYLTEDTLMPHLSRLLVLTLVLGLTLAASLHAQQADLTFEHITVDDGLPQNSVRAIIQDHLGFLWFGTQDGLVKYDG